MAPDIIVADASIDAGIDRDVESGGVGAEALGVATRRSATSTASQVVTVVALLAPIAGVLSAARVWLPVEFHALDAVLFAVFYVIAGLGITVGYHRLFTHKAFRAGSAVRVAFAIAGAMALQGPLTQWVTDHRKHHARSDAPGDPHSPHLASPGAWRRLRGFSHAHVGWLLTTKGMERGIEYGRDLYGDPLIRAIDRGYFAWVACSLLGPFAIAWAVTGSSARGAEALVWAGLVRIFVFQHATFAVNSVCHSIGRRAYATGEQSTNNVVVALLTFGEGWHNNHHAFPRSARHGLARRELDASYWMIRLLGAVGLASEIRLPTATQRARAVRLDDERLSASAVSGRGPRDPRPLGS